MMEAYYDGSNTIGGTYPGVPLFLIAKNENIAFSITAALSDVSDMYKEKLSEDKTKYYVDGEWKKLSPIFTVLATQNPLEYEGTYPLPEAQLDRFLLKLQLTYPESDAEIEIYKRYQANLVGENDLNQIEPVLNSDKVLEVRKTVATVNVRLEIIEYIHQIIKATRENPLLTLGASPRAGIYLLHTAKVYAAFQGRDYVIPDDIQEVAYMVLRHRLLVKPDALIEGKNSDLVLKNILASLKVPR
jgi:MoxR-like ATPase